MAEATFEPYIRHEPGDLITSEDWNEIQEKVKADLAANAAADAKAAAEFDQKLSNVDATKFGGKTPDDWVKDNDKRYIRRDDPGAPGQYRRYFKQVDSVIEQPDGSKDHGPCVIAHKLCRFPLIEVYELMPLLTKADVTKAKLKDPSNIQFEPDKVKFLVYYASNRDKFAEIMRTESSDWFYWGDPLATVLEELKLWPPKTQTLDDLLNDVWGKMFDPGLEQDQFKGESYGHTPAIQGFIDGDKTVEQLMSGGQWNDLRLAVRPQLLSAAATRSSNVIPDVTTHNTTDVKAFHLGLNTVDIRTPRPMDLMVLLRT